MKINDTIHGFSVVKEEYIKEQDATLYTLLHGKTGAKAAYLAREDENMTFSIAFRTLPSDNTGVFHIIEHSVLCGSEKYPVKEPFVELLKGSLNTFLNAMTYPDRTIYPLSSRCERDFENLIGIYLDAVFFPRMLENENIFLGEGWHYEYDSEENSLSYNGVVYNEMCGVYSSPDDIGASELMKELYRGTPYCYDSGGNPKFIPDLTYEDFKRAHSECYHPSNSYIYLDGSINEERTLALIDSYLSRFERREINYPRNNYVATNGTTVRVKYEIPSTESEEGRVRVMLGYSFDSLLDERIPFAVAVLTDVLCGSNESVLKKRLLDKGLCEDLSIYSEREERQTLTISAKGVKLENVERIQAEIEECIVSLCERGIEKEKLTATTNILEFKQREREMGAFPVGVANALALYSLWPYGKAAREAFEFENIIRKIREAIESDYFEKLLLSITVNNPHFAMVIMLPDKNAVADFNTEMQTRLDKELEKSTKEELDNIIATEAALKKYQSTPDSEEAKAHLPSLSLSDIKPCERRVPTRDERVDGTRRITHDMKINGISYISLFFDAADLSAEELSLLSILPSLFTNIPTKTSDPLTLKNLIKTHLGSFSASSLVLRDCADGEIYTPTLSISTSVLDSKRDYAVELLSEILLDSIFEDEQIPKILLIQAERSLEEALISEGESFALLRASAMHSSANAAKEYISGYEFYKALHAINKRITGGEKILPTLKALAERLLVRERLTVSVTGEDTEELSEKIISLFPSGEPAGKRARIASLAKRDEGFAIPSKVAYAAQSACACVSPKMLGVLRVAKTVLSYEHLWNAVRIIGGAYGGGFITEKTGEIGFYSYRDPSPASAIEAFSASADFLRELASSEASLESYIIGAYGEYDILMSPRLSAIVATSRLLTSHTPEREQEIRAGLLGTTKEELLLAADVIEEAIKSSTRCVFAGREALLKIPSVSENIIEI